LFHQGRVFNFCFCAHNFFRGGIILESMSRMHQAMLDNRAKTQGRKESQGRHNDDHPKQHAGESEVVGGESSRR
jgi:hypothetical protein